MDSAGVNLTRGVCGGIVIDKRVEAKEVAVRHLRTPILVVLLSLGLWVPLHGAELATTTPQSVGLDAARIQRVTELFSDYVDSGKLPGTVALIARHGRIAYSSSLGVKDVASGSPMTDDTIFRIYSMTKPITTVAAMTLYEEGKFLLDDPVAKYIPELEGLQVLVGDETGGAELVDPVRPITIQDLMRHTSGFTYGVFGDTMVDRMYRDAGMMGGDVPLSEFITKLSKLPLLYQPGTHWQYGVSVDVLGYLIEVLSGQTLDRFLAERVFVPLDMRDTGFYVPAEKLSRFATCYSPDRDAAKGNEHLPLKAIDEPSTSDYAKMPRFLSGGGGLVSTARDYARFLQMLLNGGELDGRRILGPSTVAFMTRNQLPADALRRNPLRGAGFGLGFAVVLDGPATGVLNSEGEYNWGGYASTEFWVDPEEDLFAIFMTQLIPSGTYPLKNEFKVALYQALESEP